MPPPPSTTPARAHELLPDFIPAALQYASLLKTGNKTGVATRVIERAWRPTPHPALAALYAASRPISRRSKKSARWSA